MTLRSKVCLGIQASIVVRVLLAFHFTSVFGISDQVEVRVLGIWVQELRISGLGFRL